MRLDDVKLIAHDLAELVGVEVVSVRDEDGASKVTFMAYGEHHEMYICEFVPFNAPLAVVHNSLCRALRALKGSVR